MSKLAVPNEDKIRINAPCAYIVRDDEKHTEKTEYPGVNCKHLCDTCGWNPKEQQRRLEKGKFVNIESRINACTGEIIPVPKGTKSLHFE